MLIRGSHVKDLPFVYEGELSYIRALEPGFEERWRRASSAHLRQWTDNFDRFVVAEIDGRTVGYAFWQIDQGEAVLASIFVEASSRNAGIGAELLKRVLDAVATSGLTRLTLSVLPENGSARRLYESFGFQPIGQKDRYLQYARSLSKAKSPIS